MNKHLTIESGLYILIFLLGLSIRLTAIGSFPLGDFEARWALSALEASRGSLAPWSMMPLYELMSGVLFFVAGGASNALARCLPALIGAALVLMPALYRPWLGRRAALLCASGLAFDPGLVITARLAGSPMLALVFSIAAAGFWLRGKHQPAAVCLAFGLLSGPHFWSGALMIVLAAALARFAVRDAHAEEGETQPQVHEVPPLQRPDTAAWITAGVVFVLAGTLFLRYPQGLGAFARSLPAYLQTWMTPSTTPLLTLALGLALYQPLAVIFGALGGGRAWLRGDATGRRLSLWVLLALVLVLVNPGRQMWDLVWVIVPLWALAARELDGAFAIPRSDVLATLGQTALIVVLFVLAWLNFAGILITLPTPEAMRMRWILIGGVFVLGMLATLLVGMGWSFPAARTGLTWGASLSLALFTVSSTFAGLQMRPAGEGAPLLLNAPAAQWIPAPAAGNIDLLTTTLGDLAETRHGDRRYIDAVVISRDPVCTDCLYMPAMRWALRDMDSVRYVDSLGKGGVPEVVITSANEPEPSLVQAYRGQSVGWWVTPAWGSGIPADWVNWVLKRSVPVSIEPVILWGRADIFPGGENRIDATLQQTADPLALPPQEGQAGENEE